MKPHTIDDRKRIALRSFRTIGTLKWCHDHVLGAGLTAPPGSRPEVSCDHTVGPGHIGIVR